MLVEFFVWWVAVGGWGGGKGGLKWSGRMHGAHMELSIAEWDAGLPASRK